MLYRNAALAFVGELRQIVARGSEVTVRGKATRELLARTVQIARPQERCITVAGRRNDTAAAIAETMWVLAGRDDMAFLARYVPRAPDYSDDGGLTWRAAYGPRLRNWNGVDQIAEVLSLLQRDPESRRAVIALYDPDRDFIEDTNDVPCNNWLHFLIRDRRLDLNVVVRSNDVLWGFSGINTFEWSVLHEVMAHWLGVEIGVQTFFISSLHLYLDPARTAQAGRVLEKFTGSTGYERGWSSESFETSWTDFPTVLERWFEIEALIAAGSAPRDQIDAFPDPLLRSFLRIVEVFWLSKAEADDETLRAAIERLGHSDLAFAATEHVFRSSADLPALNSEPVDRTLLRDAIGRLHRMKDESYRDAWKKRGEQVSVASNLARKVDRIETVSNGANPGDENLLDTAIDLFVYCLKYQTFLGDMDPSIAQGYFGSTDGPFSDGPAGFESRLTSFDLNSVETVPFRQAAQATVRDFEELYRQLRTMAINDWATRVPYADALAHSALVFLIAVAELDQQATAAFIAGLGA